MRAYVGGILADPAHANSILRAWPERERVRVPLTNIVFPPSALRHRPFEHLLSVLAIPDKQVRLVDGAWAGTCHLGNHEDPTLHLPKEDAACLIRHVGFAIPDREFASRTPESNTYN